LNVLRFVVLDPGLTRVSDSCACPGTSNDLASAICGVFSNREIYGFARHFADADAMDGVVTCVDPELAVLTR
jgi:hypothetical protein